MATGGAKSRRRTSGPGRGKVEAKSTADDRRPGPGASNVRASDVRATVRGARKAVYRELILSAAEQVFARQGFEATHMRHIAEQAQVSVGTLYGVFAGKLELFQELQRERATEILAHTRDAAVEGQDALASLLGAIDAYVGFFTSHPDYLRMHLFERTAWAYPELTTDVQLHAWQAGLKAMTKCFAQGSEEGVFVDEDPLLNARMLNAMTQVCLTEWIQQGMVDEPSVVAERLKSIARRTFCRSPADHRGPGAERRPRRPSGSRTPRNRESS